MIQYSSRFNELSLYLPTKIILNFCFKEAKKKKNLLRVLKNVLKKPVLIKIFVLIDKHITIVKTQISGVEAR